ncbi:MAG: glycosyl transferase [Marinilabiliales bacterium]|mgnify:CR=1 FL=1|nr:MAG: glycosyl transferase [Marinilabiliales bacterium]
MSEELILLILSLLLSFVLTIVFRKIAIRKSIMDIPNERSSHSIPTPRGGGMAIVITWYAALAYLFVNQMISDKLFYALLPGILLVIIGLLDDIFSISPIVRLLFQFAASVGALFFLEGFQKIDLGFYTIESTWILTPFAVFAFVWMINLYNFIDGIDGYAASEAVFIAIIAFGFIGDIHLLVLALVCIGFLVLNWQKARIFMGDAGSTLLGYTFVVFAIFYQNENDVPAVFWLILSSLFWFDATLTLLRRFRNKEKLSQAHKKHAYQRITQAGWSHQKTVIMAMLFNIVVCGSMASMTIYYPEYSLAALLITVFCLYVMVRFIDRKKSFS